MPTNPKQIEKNRYTKLLVLKSRRHKIILSLILLVIAYVFLLTSRFADEISWAVLSVPMVFMGLLTLLVPQSEQWEYKYWQDRPERHEKITFEHGRNRT